MTPHERQLIDAGAVRIPARRHKVYILHGRRVTLHSGSRPKSYESEKVKRILRHAGKAVGT